MLLDDYCPRWDFREIHSIPTHATAPTVLEAVRSISPADVPLVNFMMGIRSLPALALGHSLFRSDPHTPFLDQIIGSGFLFLGKTDHEVLLGTIGKFWRPSGGLCLDIVNAEEFKKFEKPGWAKAGWNVTVEGDGPNRRIRTETRITCTDQSARTKFRSYWWIVRPGSGMIRKSILRALKQKAEQRSLPLP